MVDLTKVNEEQAFKVLVLVDQGLSSGLGSRQLGKMCVEAAVSFAYGENHDDHPTCVSDELADIKISINDDKWSSPKKRAAGMRRLAIAQLGSAGRFNDRTFWALVEKRMAEIQVPHFKKIMQKRLDKAKDIEDLSDLSYVMEDVRTHFEEAENIIDAFSGLGYKKDDKLNRVCEFVVGILKEMKMPGCKYLYLTEKKQTAAQKKKAKALLSDFRKQAKEWEKVKKDDNDI